ncbi:hypothetical protein Tco_0214537 [Tanacetum coccineum]
MSDSKDSTVTYMEGSSPFEELSYIGSSGVVVYKYDRLPMHLPYLDYVPGPEEPEQAPHSPVYVPYVPKLVYLEFMPPKDEDEEDPEEDLEEDSADYPANKRDNDDDDDESSDNDEDDDDDDIMEDEEEEEEHPDLANSVSPPAYRTTTRISIPTQAPVPFLSEADVDRLLAIRTPPPSLLTPLSSPLPQIPPPPLPISSPLPISPPPLPASPTHPLGYRAVMIWLRTESPSTSHPLPLPPSGTPPILPIPLPTSSPPLLLPSIDCRAGVPEVCLPPRKRLCIALGLRYEIGESSSIPTARPIGGFRSDYGFVGTLDDEIRRYHERYRMTDFVTTIRHDIDEIYVRLNDAQDDRSLMSDRLNMLYRDRRAHACTARLMKTEVRLSREAWVQSMDASDIARFRVRALRTIVLAQHAKIGALRATNHTR